jgi:lysozyme
MKSVNAITLIKQFEGCKLKPYLCPAGVPTIGWGSTRYPNGVKVSMKDPAITQQKADEMLLFDLQAFEKDVTFLTKGVTLTQNNFDGLVDFAYNVGSDIDIDSTPEGLGDSTLLKKVLKNPNDPSIAAEFAKWNKSKGVVQQGLVKRRKADADLYFKK